VRDHVAPGSHPRDVDLTAGQRYCDTRPIGRCFQRICDAELLGEIFEERIKGLFGFAERRLQWPDREVESIGRLRGSNEERNEKASVRIPRAMRSTRPRSKYM
jgi:hypothetical protein